MYKEVAKLFKVLSVESRLELLNMLSNGETCGCKMIDKMTITQPTMSYHLKQLTDVGLLNSYKEGLWKKHTINYDKIDLLINYLLELKVKKGCNL